MHYADEEVEAASADMDDQRLQPFTEEQIVRWHELLNEVKPELTRAIRERREELGWSQARLATELKECVGLALDPSAITRIEQGKRDVRADELWALAVVLREPLDSLIRLSVESLSGDQLLEAEERRLGLLEREMRVHEESLDEQRRLVQRLRRTLGSAR